VRQRDFVFFNGQVSGTTACSVPQAFRSRTQWWIAWLIMPVEIISTLARLLSLTVRLFANIFASDMITACF